MDFEARIAARRLPISAIRRDGGGVAMYDLFLCDEFNAQRAYKIGLVQEVVPVGMQVDRAMELAQLIAKNAPLGIQITKEASLKFIEAGEKAAIDVIPQIRDRVYDEDEGRHSVLRGASRRGVQGALRSSLRYSGDVRWSRAARHLVRK